jgi:ParB/RepB/Spo0J family partition protein
MTMSRATASKAPSAITRDAAALDTRKQQPNLHIVRPPPEGHADGGELRTISTSAIRASRFNPRQLFEDGELQKLADSLKVHGQLQPCLVRPIADVTPGSGGKREATAALRYELVVGERRWRAAQLAKLPGVQCIVRPMSDALAIELAGIENYRRADLNAIEEARWFQSMVDTAGYTQQKLAERLGITQGQVSNRLRLLELPKVFQDQVISGEMPATWARHLATWSHRPTVMEVLATGKIKPQSEDHFCRLIASAVNECTRPLSGGFHGAKGWREVAFRPTPAQVKDLDVIEVKSWNGKERRAFNLALWDKLQAEGEARKSEREAKRADKLGANGDGRGGKFAAALARERANEQAEQFAKRLYRWKIAWLQTLLVDKLAALPGADADAMILRLLLHFTMQDTDQRDAPEMRKAITDAGGQAKLCPGSYAQTVQTIPSLLTVPDAKLRGVALDLLRKWLVMPTDGYGAHLQPTDIEALADALGVAVKRDWTLTEDYLQLHTTAQLLDLCKEWGLHLLHGVSPAKLKRADIIKCILERAPKACPKEVLTVRRPK